jgi:ketosteroid isomerase-like protein
MMPVYARASTLQARQRYDIQTREVIIIIMKMLRLIAYVAVLSCAGCGGNAGPTFDKADQEQIRRVIADLRTAFNAKDPAKAAALYSSNAAVMPPNRSLMRGRKFVEQYYVDRFAEGATDLELTPGEILGQGTLAYASGDYASPRLDRGKFLWIFREQNGQWMIEYVIFSSDFAPTGA